MASEHPQRRAIELLQQLGLKEYEAKSFVALTQLSTGTARDVADVVDVPRTRVYEAMRTLESLGLVDIQHSTPQQFRAIDIEQATTLLRDRYDSRIEDLEAALADLESVGGTSTDESLQEVWSLTAAEGIATRTNELIADASSEVVLVVGDNRVASADLFDGLQAADARDVSVLVGALTDPFEERVSDVVPDATVFQTGLDWLRGPNEEDEPAIGRLLMVDREAILASSIADDGENAVFARGLTNGFVVITRRLLATGLDRTESSAS